MSAQETGMRLQAMSDQVAEAIKGAKNQAISAMEDAIRLAEECKNVAEFPVTEVATMLGEDHNGTTAIVGNTVGIQEVTQAVQGMLQETINEMNRLDAVVDNLRFVYTNVGADILRAGG